MERRRRLVQKANGNGPPLPRLARMTASHNCCWRRDQFLITPAGRIKDVARARAVGDEIRTMIAGYHWFTDWGRDTMISLEGITLSTGRFTGSGLDPAGRSHTTSATD